MIGALEKLHSASIKPAEILVGTQVAKIPEGKLYQYASSVSSSLATHPHTMLQFFPETILEHMKKGQTILTVSSQMDLLAFAQLWKYGVGVAGNPIYEFGSWLSFAKGGYGKQVLLEAPSLGKSLDPNAQVVAIVEEENAKAQGIILGVGGKKINMCNSPVIKSPSGEPAQMKVFDITTLNAEGSDNEALIKLKHLPFIKLEHLMSEDQFKFHSVKRLKTGSVISVMVDQILSAPFVNSWAEALNTLPSVYFAKILNREINVNHQPLNLLGYKGLYIVSGFGWKAALHKVWGTEEILAHVLKVKEDL